MKIYSKILFILIILFLYSCSKDDKKIQNIIEGENIELQMIDAYSKGLKALEQGDVLFAAKKFSEAELLYPQSEWAPRAALMNAYSYYQQNYYGDAINSLERFLKHYPKYSQVSYANYLLGICYYESIVDEKKDLTPLIKAEEIFKHVVRKYPDTDFALDAKYKLDLIHETLAAKELYIAKYYLSRGKWIPAINRLKIIVKEYDTTIYIEESLHRLVEVHYKIGLEDEAKKYASLLGYNYESSEWYGATFKVFNKEYETQKRKPTNKNFILKRIKKLFD